MIFSGLRPKLHRLWYKGLGYGENGRGLDVYNDDVWLVGYPKSGNTWLNFLVASLLASRVQDVDFFTVEKLVADIYYNNAKQLQSLPRPRYLKSHETYDARYRRVIYIARDPRDVTVSYYHHFRKQNMLPGDASLSSFVDVFVAGKLGRGAWNRHVDGWLEHREGSADFLLLRYEDMKRDTVAKLGRINGFLGLEASDNRIADAVDWCSSENMRKIEQQQHESHPALRHTRQDIPFVRQANSGGWREVLSEGDVQKIIDSWGPTMQILGYE